jgi:hypothetical protein
VRVGRSVIPDQGASRPEIGADQHSDLLGMPDGLLEHSLELFLDLILGQPLRGRRLGGHLLGVCSGRLGHCLIIAGRASRFPAASSTALQPGK